MGLTDFFRNLGKHLKGEKNAAERLGQVGLSVVSDRKLEQRIKLINELHAEINTPITKTTSVERLTELQKRLFDIDAGMKTISVPYGRGADEWVYREAMFGWETLYSLSKDMIHTVLNATFPSYLYFGAKIGEEPNPSYLKELERKLEGFLEIEIFPYAFLIMDSSYHREDVAPAYTAIIHSLPGQDREDMTSEKDF